MADIELLRARAKAKLKLRERDKGESSGPSVLETIGRSGAQGASLGFSDEAAGVGSALAEAIHGDEGGVLSRLKSGYKSGREDERRNLTEDEETNPSTALVSKIVGGALPAIATGGSGVTAMGAAQGLGSSGADLTEGDVLGAAKDTAIGGVSAKVMDALFKVAPSLAKKLASRAEKMAEKATGATRVMAEKFKPGTGRELLDRKIVTFGSSPSDVASKAQAGMGKAGEMIDEAIVGMDKSGNVIKKKDIIESIESKIADLRSDPSQAPTVRQLEGYIEDIKASPAAEFASGNPYNPTMDEAVIPSAAENTKRGYQRLVRDWENPEKASALKTTAGAYQGAVEDAAAKTSPEIAEKFAKGKADWGLLAPVEDAASKRGAQLNQSPVGGFLDVTSAAAGEIAKGGAGLPAAIARRTLAPRLASSGAVALDVGAKALGTKLPPVIQNILSRLPQTIQEQKKPEDQDIPIERMGKYSQALMKAKQRSPQALSATNYILGQSDPAYRELLKQGAE